MKAHTITLAIVVAALCLIAHGCKGMGGGSTLLEELTAAAATSVATIVAWASGAKLLALAWGALAWIVTKFFQGGRTPFEAHGMDDNGNLVLPPPTPTPKLTEDPVGFFDRFVDVLWSGLWLVLIVLMILALVWRNRRRLWAWIMRKKPKRPAAPEGT